MNILIVEYNAHTPGHYSKEIFDFTNYLKSFVNNITIATPFGFYEKLAFDKKIKIKNLLYEQTEPDRFYEYQIQFYKEVKGLVKKEKYDIVHIWGYKSVFPMYFYFTKIRKKCCVVVNIKNLFRDRTGFFKGNFLGKVQQIMSTLLLRNMADKFIVHTQSLYEQCLDNDFDRYKLSKIGIGLNQEPKIKISKEVARTKLKLKHNQIFLLFFGVVRKEKGFFELLKILGDLPENYKVIIAGASQLENPIESYLDQILAAKCIINEKYIPEKEVDFYFRASDMVLILHESNFEGESGVLLKAIENSIPIIAFDDCSSAELVKENSIGELITRSENNNFFKSTEKILSNYNYYKSNLKKYGLENSWETKIPSFISLYKKSTKVYL